MKGRVGAPMSAPRRTSLVNGSLASLAYKVAAEEHKKEQESRRSKEKKVDGRRLRTKYSDDDILDMRSRYKNGQSMEKIAEFYGASDLYVYQVLTGMIRSRFLP